MDEAPKKHAGGRPRMYTRELADKICDLLSTGMPLTKICAMEGMPAYKTVMSWLWIDHPEKEEFGKIYARAREMQTERMIDEITTLADECMIGEKTKIVRDKDGERIEVSRGDMVDRSRLRVDARKWIAAKLLPRKYGDRLELSGNANDPLVIKIVQFSEKPPE